MRVWLICAAMLASVPAHARDATPPVAAASAGPTELFVELVVNGRIDVTLAKLSQSGERLFIAPDTLRAAGIAVSGDAPIDLAAPPGFTAVYDAPGQRLLLDVPPALLPTRRISGDAPTRMTTTIDTGALINYDLFVRRDDRVTTAALLGEVRLFGDFGTVASTGVLRTGFGGGAGLLRYDTSYRRVLEDSATEIAAGDFITRTLPWTTAVRMGGLQIARNFAIRPDLVTVPLPRFAGESAVASGVDLFINGFRQATANVEPGRFVLDNVPVVNGAGEARIVTTDAVGRQIATVIPFYVAPTLLRPGLTDFSAEVGLLRRDYGLRSFSYARPALSASLRHGLSQAVTLSAHVEGTRGLAGAGVGAAWRMGLLGAVHASASISDRSGRRGSQLTAGYTYDGRTFSIGAEHVVRSRAFTDLGAFDITPSVGRRSDRVSASTILRGFGSVGLGFISSRDTATGLTRLASASASVPLWGRASAFAALDYDVDRRRGGMQLRLVMPLGAGATVASAGIARAAAGRARVSGAIGHAVPTDGGLGYAVDAAIDDRGRVIGQGTATWRARAIEFEAGAATVGAARSLWGGVQGSVVAMAGRLFATNHLPDAFALVATGAPNVPVRYENQRLGTTDRRGHLFVPSVTAYHPARFAIEPVGLPVGMIARDVETRAALRPGTGAVIRLPVHAVRSITAHLVDAVGVPLPPGAIATTDAGQSLTIGYDGIVLIEQPRDATVLTVRLPGGRCTARIGGAAGADLLANVGTIRCV